MKNLLIILLSCFFLGILAQDKNYSIPVNKVSGEAYTWYTISFPATDTVSSTDTLFQVRIFTNQDYAYYYNIKHTLDSVSGNPAASIYLKGRNFDTETWSNIDTVSWVGTTSDTTFYYNSVSSRSFYRQLLIYHDAISDSTQKYKLTNLEIKIWK